MKVPVVTGHLPVRSSSSLSTPELSLGIISISTKIEMKDSVLLFLFSKLIQSKWHVH